jgi:hypothetical protein
MVRSDHAMIGIVSTIAIGRLGDAPCSAASRSPR